MKKKVGVLGGSFDPIHFGHLHLAITLAEACDLEHLYFCPAAFSPFKQNAPPHATPRQRLEMVQLAIKGIPNASVLDCEINAVGPSYTIDTLRALSQDPTLELHLLVAEDVLPTFHLWKDVKEIIEIAPPFIGSRSSTLYQPDPSLSIDSLKKITEGRVVTPLIEISSTEIRERLRQKKFCGHLIPSLVLDYIELHRLYS